jgi:hypothetical protein
MTPTRVAWMIALSLLAGVLAGYGFGSRVGDAQASAAQRTATRALDGQAIALDTAEQFRQLAASQAATIAELRASHAPAVARSSRLLTVSTTVASSLSSRWSPAATKALIRRLSAAAGWRGRQAAAMVEIARRESTFRPWVVSKAKRPKDRCYGLFQLSSGKAVGHPWRDPEWNTRAAIRYVRARYRTPVRALAHHDAHGWY